MPRLHARLFAVVSLGVMLLAGSVALGGRAARAPRHASSLAGACWSFIRELQTPPRIDHAVPAPVLARFEVLRRAQQPRDAPPADSGLRSAITGPFTTYDPSLVRRLGVVPGGAIYLVSGMSSPARISAGCRRASSADERLALRAAAGEIPAGPGYCLLEYAPFSLGRESCRSYAAAEHGATPGSDSYGRSTSYLSLVPDGVGEMTLTYQPRQPPISLTVADNLASGLAPAGFTHVLATLAKHPSRLRRFLERTLPTSVIWLSAPGGAVERRFPRTPGAVDQALREIEAVAGSP